MTTVLQKPLRREQAKELLANYVHQKPHVNSVDASAVTTSSQSLIDPEIIDMKDSVAKRASEEGAKKCLILLSEYLPDTLSL